MSMELAPAAPDGRVFCPDCGLAQHLPPLPPHSIADCARCGATLLRRIPGGITLALALALAAGCFLLPANLEPLMTASYRGAERQNLLASGVTALWDGGFPILGTVVGLLTIGTQILWLAALLPPLWLVQRGERRPWLGRSFRYAEQLRIWTMSEVYLLGAVVAYTRIETVAGIEVATGGAAFAAFALTVLVLDRVIDRHAVWAAIGPGIVPGAETGEIVDCLQCGLIAPLAAAGGACPRCAATLHRRKPDSLHRTAAFAVAAFLLYIPANTLPILRIVRFGRDDPATIFSGVRELLAAGLWPLAAIVFIASIVVPLVKLSGLTWFLIAIRSGVTERVMARTRLCRFIEGIGRWSNIDIFMLSILVALVQFGSLTRVEAEPGAQAFAAVVILTMLASRSFDARLMWDPVDAGRGRS
jgi:paraquat-inducible protein A